MVVSLKPWGSHSFAFCVGCFCATMAKLGRYDTDCISRKAEKRLLLSPLLGKFADPCAGPTVSCAD